MGAALALEAGAGPLVFRDIAGKSRLEVEDLQPCCVTGVVTYAASWVENSGIVAAVDDLNGCGVWFSGDVNGQVVAKLVGAERLEVGQVVEITGETSRLGFAPGVKADCIAVLGSLSAFPSPEELRLRDFDWGVMDNRRSRISGVLMSATPDSIAGYTRLRLATPDGDFIAHVPDEPERWKDAVDAELTLCGIAMSIFNIRGEFIGLQMEVISSADVKIVKSAPDAFASALVPLSDILPYSAAPHTPHRRRVRGTVTHVSPESLVYLQSEDGALRVRTATHGLSPGDIVEAVGFPRLENGLGLLDSAEVRRISGGERPSTVEVAWRELHAYPINPDGSYKNLDARLVATTARLMAIDGRNLAVEVDGVRVRVVMGEDLPDAIVECASANPTLRLTGVLSILQDAGLPEGRVPSISGWRLDVDGVRDVALLPSKELSHFRMMRNIQYVVVALGGIVAVLAVFLLVRFIRSQNTYRRLDILTQERKRMAGDLHDTIEQNLVAVKMLLSTSVSLSPETPEGVKEAVRAASEMLMSTKAEIRETIFNLRNDELFRRSSPEVIRSLAKRLSGGGLVKVRTMLRGLPESLPKAVFSDVIFIVQEAVTNALKHGRAKTVAIVTDPAVDGFVLRVVNDGAPFDPATALGPETGHFGLSGMAERARRNGIRFSIGVENGKTAVRLEVKT